MSDNYKHIENHNSSEKEELLFFSNVEIPYETDKQDVWKIIESKTGEKPAGKKISFLTRNKITAIAATLLLLIGSSLIMRFYTKTISTPKGEHLTVYFPDKSSVKLNAQSSVKYFPFWWRFSRSIQFTGEGYFKIAKGSKLEVASSNGKTIVLGTSFNIYNRYNLYKVTCLTGRVKVVSTSNKEAILTPDYYAEIDQYGNISVNKPDKPEAVTDWVNGMFSFSSEPLEYVIREIERQYNISITISGNLNHSYSGYFPKSMEIEQILNLICKPFGLTFVKKSETEFLIFQK